MSDVAATPSLPSAPPASAPRRRSGILAALLSLFAPGVGQLYAGHAQRGLVMLVAWIGLLVGMVALAFLVPPTFAAVAMFALAYIAVVVLFTLFMLIDAFRLARRANADTPRYRWFIVAPLVVAILFGMLAVGDVAGPVIKANMPWRSFSVPSTSMEPTIRIGEWLLGNMRHYRTHAPARGDIALYLLPSDGVTVYIKRIVAVGGDRIQFRDGRVIVNGVAQTEPFANLGDPQFFLNNTTEIAVPADHVFLAGDNRANSSDSRVRTHGPVPVKNLIARATEITLTPYDGRMGLWIGNR